MPWTVSDVDKHKKGLTTEQKKKWVKIANAALASCNAKGDSDCDGYAIRVANSKTGSMSLESNEVIKKETINKNALCLSEPLEPIWNSAIVEEKEIQTMSMLAYSGGIIPNHFYWGNLSIDTSGMTFPKDIYPILEDHDSNKKIGFAAKPIIENSSLYMKDITLLDTKESYDFVANSKKGFPYQASIYAVPTNVENIDKDATTEVNGYTFEGPGTVWRKCILKEASVCTFGYDSNTESKALSEGDKIEIEYKFALTHNSKLKEGEPKWSDYLTTENRKALPDSAFADKENRKYPHHWISGGVMYLHRGGLAAARSRAAQQGASSSIQAHLAAHAKVIDMGAKEKKMEEIMEFDINKFAETNPEEYAAFVQSCISDAVTALTAEHTDKLSTLSAELAVVTEKLTAAEEKVLAFEKEEIIQKQNALIATAGTLWTTKLSASDLPENLHDKVKLHVSYEKFIGENGLDVEAFGAAIDVEIADWIEKGITTTVLGSGFSQKQINNSTEVDVDATADMLLKLI